VGNFIDVHFMVPPVVIDSLLDRFLIVHRDGHQGYFGSFIESEIITIVRILLGNDYRVDIKPGNTWKLVARKVAIDSCNVR
jgi:hypothetical protein